MGALDRFMTNKAVVHRRDGSKQEILCDIQREHITIQDVTVRIEEGDEIHTVNPAGIEETYFVQHVLYRASAVMPKDLHHIVVEYSKAGSLMSNKNNTNQYNLNNSSLAIGSSNIVQKSGFNFDFSGIEIKNPEVASTINVLQEELARKDKDKEKIKGLLNTILLKAPEIIISILLKIFLG